MKSRIQIATVLFLSIMVTTQVKSQLYEIPLDDRINHSAMIVEGKVKTSRPFDGGNGHIYTAHKIEISRILKGTDYPNNTVTVIRRGGKIEDVEEVWSHLLVLETNETGIFFLTPRESWTPRPRNETKELFEVFSSSQGFLKFQKDEHGVVASDPFKKYFHVEEEITEKIQRLTHEQPITFAPIELRGDGDEEGCLIYTFEPAIETELLPIRIGTDIKVRTTAGEYDYYQGLIVVEYDTVTFGSNVAANGTIEIVDGDISSETVYSLSATDLAANKVQLKLETVGSLTQLVKVDTQKSFLVRVYLNIQDPFGTGSVSFDYSAMEQGNLYYDQQLTEAFPFDCIKIENEVFPASCPEITSIDPLAAAAGVGQSSVVNPSIKGEVTVIGKNFGTPSAGQFKPPHMKLGFTNAGPSGDDWCFPPERDFISWNDTMIVVRVPSMNEDGDVKTYSGTGSLLIWNTQDSCFGYSPQSLYVPFCVMNSAKFYSSTNNRESILAKMMDANGEGGYDLYYGDLLLGIDSVEQSFERALNTIRCAIKVNMEVKPKNQIPSLDDACKIDMDTTLPTGVTTVSAVTIRTPKACADASHTYIPKFDIFFNKYMWKSGDLAPFEINWYTGTAVVPSMDSLPNRDFETVALHELGHASMLLHTNNSGDVMVSPHGGINRVFVDNDKDGGLHAVEISTTDPHCEDKMVKYVCSTNSVSEKYQLNYKVFPNPTNGQINLSFEEPFSGFLTLYDSIGKRIYEENIKRRYQTQINENDIRPGIYFLVVSDDSHTFFRTTKIIVQ